ncbi:MAG: DUF488 domain-containing protein [Patescibacteria group bacterium]
MSLKTASIKSAKNIRNCFRISVMSRHTLSDGKTSDPEITDDLFDDHIPQLGPPPKLVGGYYRGEVLWPEFARRYLEYLSSDQASGLVDELIELSKKTDVVLLCIEDTPEFCHRRLLAQECQRRDPTLEVIIN